MTYLHPKCAACMAEIFGWIYDGAEVYPKYRNKCMPTKKHCRRVVERTLVDMTLTDSDTGHAERRERQYGCEQDRDSFDYHTGGKPT